MPSAQEIRAYLEKHSIQAALTAAVNASIQAHSENPLDFIGDFLKAKAVAGDGGGAPESTTNGATGSQLVVQSATFSTMISHQVPYFVAESPAAE